MTMRWLWYSIWRSTAASLDRTRAIDRYARAASESLDARSRPQKVRKSQGDGLIIRYPASCTVGDSDVNRPHDQDPSVVCPVNRQEGSFAPGDPVEQATPAAGPLVGRRDQSVEGVKIEAHGREARRLDRLPIQH